MSKSMRCECIGGTFDGETKDVPDLGELYDLGPNVRRGLSRDRSRVEARAGREIPTLQIPPRGHGEDGLFRAEMN